MDNLSTIHYLWYPLLIIGVVVGVSCIGYILYHIKKYGSTIILATGTLLLWRFQYPHVDIIMLGMVTGTILCIGLGIGYGCYIYMRHKSL